MEIPLKTRVLNGSAAPQSLSLLRGRCPQFAARAVTLAGFVFTILAGLFGSVVGSHIRSRAGMVGIDAKTIGVFTRFERTLVIAIGILINQLTIALWVLAILNNFSALQRIIYVARAARGKPKPAQG